MSIYIHPFSTIRYYKLYFDVKKSFGKYFLTISFNHIPLKVVSYNTILEVTVRILDTVADVTKEAIKFKSNRAPSLTTPLFTMSMETGFITYIAHNNTLLERTPACCVGREYDQEIVNWLLCSEDFNLSQFGDGCLVEVKPKGKRNDRRSKRKGYRGESAFQRV